MRLTIVGCSGSYPGPDSPASCYLLEHDGARLVLDLGNGAFGALQRYCDPYAVDGVVLSHLHADHCLDMCSYYVARRYRPAGPAPQIPVFGPPGTAERLSRAYDLDPEPGMTEEFEFTEMHDGWSGKLGPFTVTAAQVRHPVDAYALRVSAGGSTLVYSGDTGPCVELERLAVGADMALFEASFVESAENPDDLHMTGRDAARIAAQAGVDQVVLTHLVPWNDAAEVAADAAEVPGVEVILARPGLTLDITSSVTV